MTEAIIMIKFMINPLLVHQMLCFYYNFFSRFKHHMQTMLSAISITEITLKLWKSLSKKCWKLVKLMHSIILKWQATHLLVCNCFRPSCIFLENWSNRCQLQAIWELCTSQGIAKIFCYICWKKFLLIL